MILVRPLTRTLLQHPKIRYLPLSIYRPSSSSSHVPQKKDENALVDDKQPSIKQVKHASLKRINVEYHGIESTRFCDETLWITIYRLPYLIYFYSFIKAKVYLTVVSAILCANSINLFFVSKMSTSLFSTFLLSSLTLGGLGLIGNYFRRIVCQIYVTEDLRNIRISRFTFFGKRRDIVLPIECVVPLTETNRSVRVPLLKLKFNPPDELDLNYDFVEFYDDDLRITIQLGGVLDRERFIKVLGNILVHKIGA